MIVKGEARARDRRTLDNRLKRLPKKEEFSAPKLGWIKSIRQALGMSAADLGDRMGITRQSVLTLEDSETAGKVGMDSLKRAAEAMDCSLVYAFLPNSNLENILRQQIEKVVAERMGKVSHSMKLEDQATELTDSVYANLIKELENSSQAWHSTSSKRNSK